MRALRSATVALCNELNYDWIFFEVAVASDWRRWQRWWAERDGRCRAICLHEITGFSISSVACDQTVLVPQAEIKATLTSQHGRLTFHYFVHAPTHTTRHNELNVNSRNPDPFSNMNDEMPSLNWLYQREDNRVQWGIQLQNGLRSIKLKRQTPASNSINFAGLPS